MPGDATTDDQAAGDQAAGVTTRGARRRAAGFTLVELLVVLIILGLIAAFAAPQVIKFVGGAKTDSARIQIERLSGVLDLYRLQVGRYPSGDEGLTALMEAPPDAPNWERMVAEKRYVIVWEHDWLDCPIEVIELQKFVDPKVIRFSG